MSRAEKRRQEREFNKKRFRSDKEIQEIKLEARDEAYNKVFGVLFSIPYMALRKMGYGRIRLGRFNDIVCELLKEVETGEYDLNKAMEELKNKYGIVYNKKDGDNFEAGTIRETDNKEKLK